LDRLSIIQGRSRCHIFDQYRSTFDQYRSTFDQYRSTFDQYRSTFDQCRSTFDQYRSTFDQCRSTFDQYRRTGGPFSTQCRRGADRAVKSTEGRNVFDSAVPQNAHVSSHWPPTVTGRPAACPRRLRAAARDEEWAGIAAGSLIDAVGRRISESRSGTYERSDDRLTHVRHSLWTRRN
jgi:hypothetical protein